MRGDTTSYQFRVRMVSVPINGTVKTGGVAHHFSTLNYFGYNFPR